MKGSHCGSGQGPEEAGGLGWDSQSRYINETWQGRWTLGGTGDAILGQSPHVCGPVHRHDREHGTLPHDEETDLIVEGDVTETRS